MFENKALLRYTMMCFQFENQLISKFIYKPNGIFEAVTLYDFIEIAKNSESMGNIFTILLFSWIVVCKLRIKSDAIYLRDIFFYVKMLSTFYIRG